MTKQIYLSFVLLLAGGALFAQTRQVQLFPNGEEGVPVQAGDVFTIRANGLTVPKHPVLGTALKVAGAALAAYNAERLVHTGSGANKTLASGTGRNAALSVVGAGVVLSADKIASIGSRPGSWLSYQVYDNQAHVVSTGFLHLKKQNGQFTLTGRSPVAGLLKINRTDAKSNPLNDAPVTVNIESGPLTEASLPALKAAPVTAKAAALGPKAPVVNAPAIAPGTATNLAVIPSPVSHAVSLPAAKAIGLRAATVRSKLASIPLARNTLEASSFGLKAKNVKSSLPAPKPVGGSVPAEKAPFDIIDDLSKPGVTEPDYVDPTDEEDDSGDEEDDSDDSEEDDEGGGGDGEGDDSGDAEDDSEDDGEDGDCGDELEDVMEPENVPVDDDGEDDGGCSDDGEEQTDEISDTQAEVDSVTGAQYALVFQAWYTELEGEITSVYGGTVQPMPPTLRVPLGGGSYEVVTISAQLEDFDVLTALPSPCVTVEWDAFIVVTITTFNSSGTPTGYDSYDYNKTDTKFFCA